MITENKGQQYSVSEHDIFKPKGSVIGMTVKIGFSAGNLEDNTVAVNEQENQATMVPRKSVVLVYFSQRNMKLSYYNDQFDLHCGDLVYVDGKLEGLRGRVVEVNYNFKIKISDYKRVISVVDTSVSGQFFMAGSHFATFDRTALPGSKALTWFQAPEKEGDEFVSGHDDTSFLLERLQDMHVSDAIAERGNTYYMENRVRYISVDGSRGYAIVEGSESYEVEFVYCNGEISNLTCTCFCSYNCKHEFAAMLQLRETLAILEENYAEQWGSTDYFAAIDKSVLFSLAIDRKEKGSFTL